MQGDFRWTFKVYKRSHSIECVTFNLDNTKRRKKKKKKKMASCSKSLTFEDIQDNVDVVEVVPETPDKELAKIGDELDAEAASRKRKIDEADAKQKEANKKSKLIEPAIFVDETSEYYPLRIGRIFKALDVMRKCKKSDERYVKVIATFGHYIMLSECTNFREFIRKCSETLCVDQSHMYEWLKFIADPSATQDRFKRAVELVNGLRNKFMIPLLKDDEQFLFS